MDLFHIWRQGLLYLFKFSKIILVWYLLLSFTLAIGICTYCIAYCQIRNPWVLPAESALDPFPVYIQTLPHPLACSHGGKIWMSSLA